MENKIKTYKEFYQFYLTQHSNKSCRIMHFVGTTLVLFIMFLAVYLNDFFLWFFVPIVGYGFAWVGHFYFEKNKPAAFKYPFWSLISDFKMFFEILIGKISFDTSRDKL